MIQTINYRGLHGRVLKLNSARKTDHQTLFIYGSHASIERIAGVTEVLARASNITMPDLPGMGGMDSLYKIGRRPTFNELSEYLAWFIRREFPPETKFNLIGMSQGFAILTRLLQNHPDIAKRTRLVISYIGVVDKSNFRMSAIKRRLIVMAAWILERRIVAWLMRRTFCTRPVLKFVYKHTNNEKFRDGDFDRKLDIEVNLWQENDVRTWARAIREMLTLHDQRQINAPVISVTIANDRYLDSANVATSLKQIYRSYREVKSDIGKHSFSAAPTAREGEKFVPREILKILGESS